MAKANKRFRELAPCGIFCEACPAYDRTCLGCASESKDQNRISKWACRIRICCYDKELDYCIFCGQFPCKIVKKKLLDTHPGDIRYTYRHEIPFVCAMLRTMNTEEYIKLQRVRWKCDVCDGTIKFYNYTCDHCGKESFIKKG